MIATKLTVGAFVVVAMAKSYLNVWGLPPAVSIALTVWGGQ
jgi:hypothetical protein